MLATMVDPATPYASRLQQAMRKAGKNPDDTGSAGWFAREMGFSYQAAKKAISGETKQLKADNNSRAALLLNVDPDWLATGEGSPDSESPAASISGGTPAYLAELAAKMSPEKQERLVAVAELLAGPQGDQIRISFSLAERDAQPTPGRARQS